MPWLALAASAASTAYGAYKSGQAADKASQPAPQVNLDQLNQQIQTLATQNALASRQLEQQLTPEVPQLRTDANNSVIASLNNNDLGSYAQALQSRLGQPVAGAINPSLLNSAIGVAQQQLNLGGQLPQDVRNLVAREAASKAGTVAGPGGNLGLGRDISARDLGLTSLDLLNQRIGQAGQLGQAQAGVQQFNVGTQFGNNSNFLNQLQALQGINQQRFGQGLSAAQYGQGIQQPMVGLDPSAMANLTVGNTNAQAAQRANQANIYGQQGSNLLNFGGQLYGFSQLGGQQSQYPYPSSTQYGGSGYSPAPSSFYGQK